MAFVPQGGFEPERISRGIAKRDSDRSLFAAKQAARLATRNRRSHKRGFGTMRSSERFA